MTDYDYDFENCEAFKLFRNTDPSTSKEAAFLIDTKQIGRFVYQVVKDAGIDGITIPEMQRKHASTGGTLSSRPNELEKAGKIFYAGDKRTPFNQGGSEGRVMRAAEYKKFFREDGTRNRRQLPVGYGRTPKNK